MPEVIETTETNFDQRLDVPETPAGLRSALRAFVGRLGNADAAPAFGFGSFPAHLSFDRMEYGLENMPLPDRLARSNAWETGHAPSTKEDAAPVDALPARATAMENRLAKLRANAHAAYASVVGRHEVALDATLSVMEAELRTLADRSDAQIEILKQVRLYARDAQSRELARRGLEACADVLACCQPTKAGCPSGEAHRN